MSTPLNTSKPVRFAGTYIGVEKGKVDGKGNAEVTFKIYLSLADEHDQTTAYQGRIRWKVEIWVPGIGYSDSTLDLLYGRRQTTYQTHVDVHWLTYFRHIHPEEFFRATDEEHREQIWHKIVLRPIKLKVDVVEWRYNYELWFRPKGLFSSELYEGHKSEYWSLELR
jgi:hypothetical protein